MEQNEVNWLMEQLKTKIIEQNEANWVPEQLETKIFAPFMISYTSLLGWHNDSIYNPRSCRRLAFTFCWYVLCRSKKLICECIFRQWRGKNGSEGFSAEMLYSVIQLTEKWLWYVNKYIHRTSTYSWGIVLDKCNWGPISHGPFSSDITIYLACQDCVLLEP